MRAVLAVFGQKGCGKSALITALGQLCPVEPTCSVLKKGELEVVLLEAPRDPRFLSAAVSVADGALLVLDATSAEVEVPGVGAFWLEPVAAALTKADLLDHEARRKAEGGSLALVPLPFRSGGVNSTSAPNRAVNWAFGGQEGRMRAKLGGSSRAFLKAVVQLALAVALGLLWWLSVRRATEPAIPPPGRVATLKRPGGLPPPPRAKFDLEEFRWRNEDASFRWH